MQQGGLISYICGINTQNYEKKGLTTQNHVYRYSGDVSHLCVCVKTINEILLSLTSVVSPLVPELNISI